jgi:hypothetical protein
MELNCHYRVAGDGGGCEHCEAGKLWTVVHLDPDGEECGIGTSWMDKELAEDICDLMNMAYEAGLENTSTAEPK